MNKFNKCDDKNAFDIFEGDKIERHNNLQASKEDIEKVSREAVEQAMAANPNMLVPSADVVNHPQHYMHGGIETIDVIKAWTDGLSGFEAVLAGNVIKYISRWKQKNGLEDLKKAAWYLERLIEFEEE